METFMLDLNVYDEYDVHYGVPLRDGNPYWFHRFWIFGSTDNDIFYIRDEINKIIKRRNKHGNNNR